MDDFTIQQPVFNPSCHLHFISFIVKSMQQTCTYNYETAVKISVCTRIRTIKTQRQTLPLKCNLWLILIYCFWTNQGHCVSCCKNWWLSSDHMDNNKRFSTSVVAAHRLSWSAVSSTFTHSLLILLFNVHCSVAEDISLLNAHYDICFRYCCSSKDVSKMSSGTQNLTQFSSVVTRACRHRQ